MGSGWILRVLKKVGRNIKFNKGQFTDMGTITYDTGCYSLLMTLEDRANMLLRQLLGNLAEAMVHTLVDKRNKDQKVQRSGHDRVYMPGSTKARKPTR